jgi:DNA polymerase
MYGAGPGRWSSPSAQLQNLKKNESNLPLSVVDAIRRGDRDELARYGNPLTLLGDVLRAALCASEGMELKSGDFSAMQSVILAWLSGEWWKIDVYKTHQQTGDTSLEPYRVIARKMLGKPADAEINTAERQMGKGGELAAGFGGSVGAWRRIMRHDPHTDEEIAAAILQWRDAHPATTKYWRDTALAIRVAMRSGEPILIAEPPQPPVIAAFADGNLTLTLPSGRAITYPEARFIPGKFEDGPPDVQFMDNARGQWQPTRGWFGIFVENIVQGIERDWLAAAIERLESRGIPVVHHNHDEVTVEVPIGWLPDQEFLEILLTPPAWMAGLMPLRLPARCILARIIWRRPNTRLNRARPSNPNSNPIRKAPSSRRSSLWSMPCSPTPAPTSARSMTRPRSSATTTKTISTISPTPRRRCSSSSACR